jgi:hypothetical protein
VQVGVRVWLLLLLLLLLLYPWGHACVGVCVLRPYAVHPLLSFHYTRHTHYTRTPTLCVSARDALV